MIGRLAPSRSAQTSRRSTAPALLRAVGSDPDRLRTQATTALARFPSAAGATVSQPQLARATLNAVTAAEQVAQVLPPGAKLVESRGMYSFDSDVLVVIESMKMEIPVITEDAGVVKEILVKEKDPVAEGQVVAILEG